MKDVGVMSELGVRVSRLRGSSKYDSGCRAFGLLVGVSPVMILGVGTYPRMLCAPKSLAFLVMVESFACWMTRRSFLGPILSGCVSYLCICSRLGVFLTVGECIEAFV
jgi:hypothetical protein